MIRKKFQQTLAKFNSEVSGMHDAAYLLAGFALLSTLLALVRDKLLAHVFGAGVQLDIYYAAFRIPDLVFTVVASMVSVFVLIPFLSRRASDSERQSFIHTLLIVFGGLLVIISTIIAIFTPQIVEMFFRELVMRGYGSELVVLVRILLIQPLVLGLSSIVSSVVQYYGRYFIYALAPLLYNVGIIVGILLLVPRFGITGLGYGVILGSLLHLAIQLPSFYKLGFVTRVTLGKYRDALEVMLVSLPRTVALSANQITLFVLVAMAGTMSEGSIAIFTLAFNLQAAPVSIVGVSYSTAAFPTLSKLFARGASHEFTQQITAAARHIVFWSLPIIALVIVLRAQVVRVIYGSGAFDWTDTRLTAAALALFIISLTAQCLVLLFVRGYYAACKTFKPQVLTVLSAVMTVIFAVLLEHTYASNEYWRNFLEAMMRTDGTGSTGVLMLPLAYTLSSCITALLFLVLFAYDFRGSTKALRKTFWESLVGAFIIGAVAYITLGFFSDIVEMETLGGIFLQGSVAGLLGIIAGVIVLIAIGNTEVRTVWQVLHHKVWKTKKIIAETDIT